MDISKIKKILAEMKLAKQEICMGVMAEVSVIVCSLHCSDWGTFFLGSAVAILIPLFIYLGFRK